MGLLQIDPGLVIWTLVTFLVLLLVLRKVAWKPILAIIDERERTVRETLEEAEKARAEAQAEMEEYRRKLTEARKSAREIINEGRESAEKIRQDILTEAQAQKQSLLKEAKRQIEAEREKAIHEIRETVADLAVNAAAKIINQQLTPEKHQEIIERSLQEFEGDLK